MMNINRAEVKPIVSSVVLLLVDNIDTDQIIPARYLKIVDKLGLGKQLFADWRYDQDGAPNPGFILNKPASAEAKILLAGENFGCGSSREHAPWALHAFGFEVIIACSFADIFKNNAVKNGLLPVELPAGDHRLLVEALQENPQLQIRVELIQERIILPTGKDIRFTIDPFTRRCFLEGIHEMEYLLDTLPAIETFEKEPLRSI